MNNEVILYKTEFTTSGVIQPYFKTVEGRDNYFNSCPHISANLNNPNLVIEKSLSINIQVPFDITVIEDYNFVVFTYNNKTYYAYIVDYEMVSFGFTRLLCHRCVLAEKTNFLQYYKHLQVNSISVRTLNNMQQLYIPEGFRVKRRIDNALPKPEDNLINSLIQKVKLFYPSAIIDKNITFIPSFIINATTENGSQGYSKVGHQPTLYNTYVIPLISDGSHKYASINYSTGNIEELNDIIDYADVLPTLSPYIINIGVIALPYLKINFNNKSCFFPYFQNSQIENKYLRFLSDSINYDGVDYNFRLYIDLYSNFNKANFYHLFEELNIYEYDFSTPINLKLKEYSDKNNNCKLSLSIQYKFSVDGFYIINEIINAVDGAMQPAFSSNKIFSTAFSANTTLVIDSSENFKAQNKYYDAITNQQIYNEAALGSLQSAENLMIGGFQLVQGLGGFTGTGLDIAGKLGVSPDNTFGFQASGGTFGLGVGNVIRGIFGAAQMGVKIDNIQKMRDLEAKTQSSQPAKFSPCSGSITLESILHNNPFKIETITPLDDDYDVIVKNMKVNGCKCNLFFENGEDLFAWWEPYKTEYLAFSGAGIFISDLNNDFIDAFNALIEIHSYFKIIE